MINVALFFEKACLQETTTFQSILIACKMVIAMNINNYIWYCFGNIKILTFVLGDENIAHEIIDLELAEARDTSFFDKFGIDLLVGNWYCGEEFIAPILTVQSFFNNWQILTDLRQTSFQQKKAVIKIKHFMQLWKVIWKFIGREQFKVFSDQPITLNEVLFIG